MEGRKREGGDALGDEATFLWSTQVTGNVSEAVVFGCMKVC